MCCIKREYPLGSIHAERSDRHGRQGGIVDDIVYVILIVLYVHFTEASESQSAIASCLLVY